MRPILLVLTIALTSCIQSGLVPCGDLLCPVGYLCQSERCVSTEQLAECADKAQDDRCSIGGAIGVCQDGACVVVGCGNGVVDPGELCDDGNAVSGDGCSNTCTSTELCGNAITDVGETCDCGTVGHLSSRCNVANSDDPSAPCSATCQMRFCGDDVVDTIEQCDGSVPVGATCDQFGYYRGTPSCSSLCQLDPGGCTGRCGDHVVDSADGEYCDGATPNGASCTGFGFDLGPLGCSGSCAPSLAACGQFGWSVAHDRSAVAQSMWGGHGRIGVVYDDGTAWVLIDGAWVQAPASYAAITGTASTGKVWAVGPAHVASWTEATGWVDQAAPWPSDNIMAVWASDSLGLFVSFESSAPLWRNLGGTWSQVTGAWDPAPRFGKTRTELYLLDSAGVVRFDGASWTPWTELADPVTELAEDAESRLWAVSYAAVFRRDGATWTPQPVPISGVVSHITPDDHGVFLTSHQYQVSQGWIGSLIDMTGTQLMIKRDGTPAPFASDGNGVAYSGWDTGGVYVLRYGRWNDDGYFLAGYYGELPGGPLLRTDGSGGFYQLDATDSWNPITPPRPDCTDLRVARSGTIYCPHTDGLLVGTTEVPFANPGEIWVTPDESAAMVLGSGEYAYRGTGSWTTHATTTSFSSLRGDALSSLFALGWDGTDSHVYAFDGSSWSMLAGPGGLQTLAVTPTTVYGQDIAGITAWDRVTHVARSVSTPVLFNGLVHGTGEELFASSPGGNSHLWWFDGIQWSPIRLPTGYSNAQIMLSTGDQLLITSHIGGWGAEVLRLERTRGWAP